MRRMRPTFFEKKVEPKNFLDIRSSNGEVGFFLRKNPSLTILYRNRIEPGR